MARQLARNRIVFAARRHQGAHAVAHLLHGRDALGKQAHLAAINRAVFRARTADDVVIEHAGDVEIFQFCLLRPMAGTQQPLFLGRHGHEDDGGVEAVARHRASHLDHGRRTRCVIVGAGRVALRIHHVGGARVVMAADDIDASGRLWLTAGQGRDHVDDFRRPRNAL
ncbi:hypothetical protein D3C72_1431960 [compost metagenome]